MGMMKRRSGILAIAFATAAVPGIFLHGPAGRAAQNSEPVELRVGRMFPTTVFPSLDSGRPASIADFRGKKLILHIFASW